MKKPKMLLSRLRLWHILVFLRLLTINWDSHLLLLVSTLKNKRIYLLWYSKQISLKVLETFQFASVLKKYIYEAEEIYTWIWRNIYIWIWIQLLCWSLSWTLQSWKMNPCNLGILTKHKSRIHCIQAGDQAKLGYLAGRLDRQAMLDKLC